MRRIPVLALVVALLGATSACKTSSDAKDVRRVIEPEAEGSDLPIAPAGPAAQPDVASKHALVTSVTAIRVDKLAKAKSVGSLSRGEEVTVMEDDGGGWSRVITSGDVQGFVQSESLLPSDGVQSATFLNETKVFLGPDLLKLDAKRVLLPGHLVFVIKTVDQFSQVNTVSKTTSWVLSENLVTDPAEVAASRLFTKHKWLKERKDPDAAKLFELAQSQFAGTRVVSIWQALEAGIDLPQGTPASPSGGAPGLPPDAKGLNPNPPDDAADPNSPLPAAPF